MVHGFTELHQRRLYVAGVLPVFKVLGFGENLARMEWTKSESTYSSCNEARTANSMLAIMFGFASSAVREAVVPFSVFISHPLPLFTATIRIRQME
jgi:hypothetical protein